MEKNISNKNGTKNKNALKKQIKKALLNLSEKEQQVIALLYGLEDGFCHSYEDLEYVFKVSIDEIKKMKSNAFKKLKSFIDVNQLEKYRSN